MQIHLIDGTYELFRFHYARYNRDPRYGAQRGVLKTLLDLLEGGATHVGVATDHVIESFRNGMLSNYKTGEGIEPELRAQFEETEELLRLAGFTVWPQMGHEADDALASAAVVAATDAKVKQVLICTPDKDLAQCVTLDGRVVQYDRRREIVYDYQGVIGKFGVRPESIPDYLGLVGDTADGIPGLAGWGAKSTSEVLWRYGHITDIPLDADDWDIQVRGAARLARTLRERYEDALLFKRVATVALDAPVAASADDLKWQGPLDGFNQHCAAIDAEHLATRAFDLANKS
ncbi:MAG: flap endonuclease [Acidimicrobiaceae bacterium]|nr:flap endonuclease [Acidimicrobiaceae bacterium]